jgi:hypothetical protein
LATVADAQGIEIRSEAMTLDEIVADYIQKYRPHGQAEARFFRRLDSLAEAINHAVRPGGRKHPHQYLIPPSLLDEAERRLQRAAPELASAMDFADLYGVMERDAGSIHGIGRLAIYDIAHRIGMHLGKAPELVYLHRGAREGAAVLGFRGKTLAPKLLPPAFSRLKAAEIEDCLCIYKRELADLATTVRSSAAKNYCLQEMPRVRSKC